MYFRFETCALTKMNGAWVTPEWEAATMALEKLQNEKNSMSSGSDDKPKVKSTSAAAASASATRSTMSYDASFYSQHYAAYQHLYAPYGMYGFGPYSPYGYMPFAGTSPQQMQPPPPPPPSAKIEPKSESSNEQSSAASSTAASVGADATSCSSNSSSKAGNKAAASVASTAQNTWPKASSGDSASYPGSWQPSVGTASSTAEMWQQFQNMPRPRLKSSGTSGFQRPRTTTSVGSGSWQHSADAVRPSRPAVSSAMPSLRWSNSPRVNPYDGKFRQAVPNDSSEPYCPFDPTESEESEDRPTNSEYVGAFSPAPDAGNIRFRMPNRGACRPMHWRQTSPRPRFGPELQFSPREPVQHSPNWRYGQYSAQQQASQPDQENARATPVVMPRMKNYMPRARAPWSAGRDTQKMPNRALKPSELQESRWDKDETVSNVADGDRNTAGPSAESGALDAASADDWPTPLKQFVHRCFSSVKDDSDKDLMEAKLKVMLTAAFGSGTALTHDWDHEQIPDIRKVSPSFQALGSPSASDRYGRPSSNLCSPRNFKFAGSVRGRHGTPSSSSRRGRGWSPPAFRRRSRSRSQSRSRSSSHSSSSSNHSSHSRRRRHRRRRDSR